MELQKTVRIGWFLTFTVISTDNFYNSHALSTQHLLWDISAHRQIFDPQLTLPPCLSISDRVSQKSGENWSGFDYFAVISTHNFCNSHAVISETCDRGYLIPQTDFWTVALTTPPCWSIQQGTAKNSENWLGLTFLLWFLLTIFTIHMLASPKSVIEDISLSHPTDQFLTWGSHCPPSDDIRKWWPCKKNHKNESRSY